MPLQHTRSSLNPRKRIRTILREAVIPGGDRRRTVPPVKTGQTIGGSLALLSPNREAAYLLL
jgi:ABC-type dipeptide/oligopeptide/nickel transport system ATPase subunit